MLSKISYERQLLNEVKNLRVAEIKRIVKIVQLIREDILERKIVLHRKSIMQYSGMFSEMTKKEVKVFDREIKRRDLFGGRVVKI